MKLGEFATVSEIMNQAEKKWVVLADLQIIDDTAEVIGGIIKFIENTKNEASKKAERLYENNIDALLVPGLPDEAYCLGGVLVQ